MVELSRSESELLVRLQNQAQKVRPADNVNMKYYQGRQKVRFLGLRLREEWQQQAFPLTWCRTMVNVVVERLQVLRLLRRGQFTEDENLRLAWDRSDMSSQLPRMARDLCIYGRAFVSVSATADGRTRMQVEPVRAMTLLRDPLNRVLAGLRTYVDEDTGKQVRRVLYLPNETIVMSGASGSEVEQRIWHGLGRVPIVMAEMPDPIFEPLKHLADMSAEALLNMRVALEATASPQKAIIDAARNVVDEAGNEVDLDADEVYDAFYDSILRLFSGVDEQGKVVKADIKQFPGADMTGFIKALDVLGQQASSASGLPMRMLGHVTANPPSEMTVRGEESRLVRLIEVYAEALGAALGWALSIDERIRTGVWPEDGSIDVSWRDPGTPTQAQHADALTKLVQTGIMSRRSALEDLGWSDARIDREMERLSQEADPMGMAYRSLGRPVVEDAEP